MFFNVFFVIWRPITAPLQETDKKANKRTMLVLLLALSCIYSCEQVFSRREFEVQKSKCPRTFRSEAAPNSQISLLTAVLPFV